MSCEVRQNFRFPANSLTHIVPKELTPAEAVYIEPLACAIHCVERGDIQFNDVVVVSGCGSLGLGMIAAAARKHPKLLIALDTLDFKLDVAKACGADLTLNVAKCDAIAKIKELTDGYGCDVYIEAAGASQSVIQGMQVGGRVVALMFVLTLIEDDLSTRSIR